MTKFKKCQIVGCGRTLSKPYKMLGFKPDKEKIGKDSSPVHLKVCNKCFEDYSKVEDSRFSWGNTVADPIDNPLAFYNVKVVRDVQKGK